MQIYRHLDWLDITLHSAANWKRFLPGSEWKQTGKGYHGYKRAWQEVRTGVTAQDGADDPKMTPHITMTGIPLAELKAVNGWSDNDLATMIQKGDCKCSRLDMAIDCWGAEFTPGSLALAIEARSAHVPARTWRYIDGHSGNIHGATFETGAPSSEKRFRFYDKTAEQRIVDGQAWVRLELQLRNIYARFGVGSCAENGTEATITGHIGAYLKWDNPDYQHVLIADSVPPKRQARPLSNRREWLNGQVARALAGELVDDPAYREQFDLMVDCWVEQLTNR